MQNPPPQNDPLFPIPVPLMLLGILGGYGLYQTSHHLYARVNARTFGLYYIEWTKKASAGDREAAEKLKIANKRLRVHREQALLGDDSERLFLDNLKRYNITEKDYLKE